MKHARQKRSRRTSFPWAWRLARGPRRPPRIPDGIVAPWGDGPWCHGEVVSVRDARMQACRCQAACRRSDIQAQTQQRDKARWKTGVAFELTVRDRRMQAPIATRACRRLMRWCESSQVVRDRPGSTRRCRRESAPLAPDQPAIRYVWAKRGKVAYAILAES